LSKSILDGLDGGHPQNSVENRLQAEYFCGDIDMRIARDGTWYYRGTPITRQAMVKLFASVLRRDETGDFWLETPVEKCRIQVDDAPFSAIEMESSGAGDKQVLKFRTTLDDIVTAGPDHPIRVVVDVETGEPSPYIRIRGGLDALIARPVFYDLVELGVEEQRQGETVLGVWSNGVFFMLGPVGGEQA
jgi:hypothetical protein